jgi:hypothetical protein
VTLCPTDKIIWENYEHKVVADGQGAITLYAHRKDDFGNPCWSSVEGYTRDSAVARVLKVMAREISNATTTEL